MECEFGKSRNNDVWVVRLDGKEIPKNESFWYIGSLEWRDWRGCEL